ncbi:MAG: Hsp33 family molecular chaperone HslO, partial [Bacteroidales bacterium]|nr:Hsp33 family molecular chaperone HslO [Bacteroidales bacterium]
VIDQVMKDLEPEIVDRHPVEYRCYCSRERVRGAIATVGTDALPYLIYKHANLTKNFDISEIIFPIFVCDGNARIRRTEPHIELRQGRGYAHRCL